VTKNIEVFFSTSKTTSSFIPDTAQKVMDALKEVRRGASAVVMDLLDHVGGYCLYMPAGVDVAKLFLPPQARVSTP
jgi:C-terminal processing protease CtpA/Prc